MPFLLLSLFSHMSSPIIFHLIVCSLRHWFLHIPVVVVIYITYTSESDTSFSNASASNANNDIKWRGCSSWVLNVLTSSKELIDLIKNVDIVFHSKPSGSSKSMLNNLYKFVPSIREQLQLSFSSNSVKWKRPSTRLHNRFW